MKKNDILICAAFFLIGIFSRLPFVETIQSHWDGPQYSIAVVRYSLEQETPSPPGYPLYIGLAKFFYLFIHDPHEAVILVSVLGSATGALAFYLIGKNLNNRKVGIVSSVIFLTGSTFYYFGLTPYAYGLLPLLTVSLAYYVYEIFIRKRNYGLLLGLVFGICFGFRPQETIQTGFLVFLGFLYLGKIEKIKFVLTFIIVTLLWFLPLAHMVGFQNFFTNSIGFAASAFPQSTLVHNAELMIKGFLLSFGVSGIFLFYYLWYVLKKKPIKWQIVVFYCAWILPGILFNLFIRTDHAGYQMSYLSGLLLLIGFAIWQVTKRNKIVFIVTVILISTFNLVWFFYDRDPHFVKPYRPTSFHYSDIRKNDLKTGSKVKFVSEKFNPKTTLIVSNEILWRPYSYYLKSYTYVVLFRLDNNEIPYSFNRIDEKDWNMNWYTTKNFDVKIPQNISTVVFMDDETKKWIKKYPFKVYKLPGNSYVTAISVSPKSKIVYNYHLIEVKKL